MSSSSSPKSNLFGKWHASSEKTSGHPRTGESILIGYLYTWDWDRWRDGAGRKGNPHVLEERAKH